MERLWRELGHSNAASSAAALGRFAQGDEAAADFLLKQLSSPPGIKTNNIDKWVADLSSEKFVVRDQAMRELKIVGNLAAPALKVALQKAAGLEAKRRLEMLLDELGPPPSGWLQANRALEALEMIGNRHGLAALETLAKDSAETWVRLEAEQALKRLDRRAAR